MDEDNKVKEKHIEDRKGEEGKQAHELERLHVTLAALDQFQKQECSLEDAWMALKDYMHFGHGCVNFFGTFEKEQAIQKLHDELKITHECLERNLLQPSDVIEKSNATRGTYFARDETKPTLQLIRLIKQDVEFETPNKAESNREECDELERKDTFHNAYKKSDLRCTSDIDKATAVRKSEIHGCKVHGEKNKQPKTRCCITSNCIVPVTLWKPNITQITLTKNAFEKIEQINKCLLLGTNENNAKAKTLAVSFLKEFGSHIYFGDVHFGGSFKVEAACENDSTRKIAKMKELVKYKHLVSLHVTKSVAETSVIKHEDYLKEKCKSKEEETHEDSIKQEGKSKEEETHNVKITVSVFGGPSNVSSFHLWKKCLVYDNETWAVVHAGEPKISEGKLILEGYIGIWDLVEIQMDHANALEVAQLLRQAWEEMSGYKSDDILCDTVETLRVRNEIKTVIENASSLLASTMEAHACVDIFQDLYQKVVEYEMIEGCQEIWKLELASNSSVVDIFKKMTTTDLSEDQRSEVERLFFLLKYNSLRGATLNSLSDLQSSLKCYMRNLTAEYNRIKSNTEGHVTFQQDITMTVGTVVSSLLNMFKAKTDSISYIFLLSIVLQLDYDVNKEKFQDLISFERLQTFQEKLDRTTTKFHQCIQMPSVVRKACVFYQLIEGIKNSGIYSKPIAQQTFFRMLKHIKNLDFNFDASMMSRLDEATVNLNDQLKSLEEIANDSSVQRIVSWEYFEKLQDIQYCKKTDASRAKNAITVEKGAPIKKILELLNLYDYFPGQLSLQTVLSINDIKFKGARSIADIPWVILNEIIAVNFHFRERVLDDFLKTVSTNEEEDDDGDLLSNPHADKDTGNAEILGLHPLDVFMAIFQCCDPFLKRVLVQKISLCQLAVPYVFKDYSSGEFVLSLWPLRDIYTDFKSECVATQELKTVSFVKIGDGFPKSKSKIINEFLRDINEEHSTFFHRDCPLGMNQRKLTNGMIEASWYVSAQTRKNTRISSDTKTFKSEDPLTVMNLRGDAFVFQEQLKTVLELSNVIVVLISDKDMQNEKYSKTLKIIHSSNSSVILLTNLSVSVDEILQTYRKEKKIESHKTKVVSTFVRNGNRLMNQTELQNRLRKNIFSMLKDIPSGIKLEQKVACLKISSDDNDESKRMQAKAEKIHKRIREYGPFDRKQYVLPLQGKDLWHKWSKKQKEQKRPQYQPRYNPDEPLLMDMRELRYKQVDACNEPPDIIAQFVQVLVEIVHDDTCINYFLFWMRQFFDDESRIVIPKLLDEFLGAFEKYESAEIKTRERKQEIDGIEKKLVDATFGLEHFLREIGQIYEAFLSIKEDLNCTIAVESQQIICLLPMVAAKLVLLGQPLEIMDGDAANVPMKWIQAVFHEIKGILGDVKLLSISVLGIQSSGKSTLLNTIFGSRFPVSAGRCTRGIFAQLLPIDKSKSSFEFDYALVMDTEGLRAPELAGEKVVHDNELATIVIGAADVVLINVKGETITDLEDVLQIVIHGLLRIRQVNKNIHLRQCSMFVHQNVSAENANKQNIQGNKKIVEILDRMTYEVANQVQLKNVSCFRDVIKFDPTKDVRYVPDRWHGGSKMAPASPEYSSSVKHVAQDLLNIASSRKLPLLFIPNTISYIDSLWNGILAEDFVFSFRNCLEVKAYSLLESEYQRIVFSLDMLKLDWITNNVKPNLYICKGLEELELVSENLFNKFEQELGIEENKATEDLNNFIDQSEFIDHMIQWKDQKIFCLHGKVEILKQEIKDKIRTQKEKSVIVIAHSNLLVKKEEQINRKAKSLASSLIIQELTDIKMQQKFQELWIQWLSELAPEAPLVENRIEKLKKDMILTIKEKYSSQKHLIDDGLKKHSLDMPLPVSSRRLENSLPLYSIKDTHIQIPDVMKKIIVLISGSHKSQTMKIINNIFGRIDVIFDDLSKTDMDYEKANFSKVLGILSNSFKSHNESQGREFSLTQLLEVLVVLHVSRYSYQKFKTQIIFYEQGNCIRTSLLKYKPQAQRLFIDTCKSKSQEIIATNVIRAELKLLIREKIERNISGKIQADINERYFSQKSSLIKRIMEELAELDEFDRYMQYVRRPIQYALDWITELTNSAIFSSSNDRELSLYQEWTEKDTTNLVSYIKDAVNFTTKKCEENSGSDIQFWKSVFVEQISGRHLLLSHNSFWHVRDYNIKSFHEFRETIFNELSIMERELINEFRQNTPNTIKWTDKTPYECIFDTLWGCKATCPFCAEPCQRAQPNHQDFDNEYHTCIQHRNTAVTGCWWTNSNQLAVESCNFQVQSSNSMYCGSWCKCSNPDVCRTTHPYKLYKKYYPGWDIQACTDTSSSIYWNWFVATHKSQLSKYHKKDLPDIPITWESITKYKAKQSLNDVFPNRA